MSGRIAVAPCGHTGETIIGTYVKCLVGCEGKPVQNARGEPGHVLNCACGSCQIRRKSTHVIFRTRDGKDFAKLEWDGVADKFRFVPTQSGWISGFRFVDADGKIVADGRIADGFGEPVYVEAGIPMTGQAKFMLRDANMRMEVTLHNSLRKFDPSKVIVSFRGIELKPSGNMVVYRKGSVSYSDGT